MSSSYRGYESLGLSAAIGALVAVYFGQTWLVDAPRDADKTASSIWFAADWTYKFALYAAAGLLALSLVAQFARLRAATLLGLGGHGIAAVAYAAMLIDTLLETGASDILTCVMLAIVGLVSGQQAADLWRAWRIGTALPGPPKVESNG